MTTQEKPLDDEQQNQPQEDDGQEFDSAFDEFAKGDDADNDEPGDDDNDPGPPDEAAEQQEQLTQRERELQEQLERIRHSEASNRGRIGAYQRKINELSRALEQTKQPPSPANTANRGQSNQNEDQQRQNMAEEMGVDDWESFKEDFPDMARAFEARLQADRQKQAQLERQVSELQSAVEPIQQQAHEQHLKAQEDALTARHPDWREVVAAPAFAEWLNNQPNEVRGWVESDNAADAARVLDLYRVESGQQGTGDSSRADTHDKRQSRLANAQTVSRRGKPNTTGVPDDFESAFDHFSRKKQTAR